MDFEGKYGWIVGGGGGGGAKGMWAPSKIIGGGAAPHPLAPLPTPMLGQKKFLYMKFLVLPWQLRKM